MHGGRTVEDAVSVVNVLGELMLRADLEQEHTETAKTA
jgi:hypothetical protein